MGSKALVLNVLYETAIKKRFFSYQNEYLGFSLFIYFPPRHLRHAFKPSKPLLFCLCSQI